MSPSACFCPRRNKGCKSNREEPPPASRPGGSASQDRGLRDQSPGVRPKGPSRRLRQHPSPLRLPLGCSAGKQPEMPLAGERTPPKRGVGAARGVAAPSCAPCGRGRRRPEGAAGGHGRSEQDSHPRPSDSAAVVSDHWSRPMGAGGPLVGLAGAPWSGRQQLGVPTSCFFIPAPPPPCLLRVQVCGQ